MNNPLKAFVFFILLSAVVGLSYYLKKQQVIDSIIEVDNIKIDCQLTISPCRLIYLGKPIDLSVNGQVLPLTPFGLNLNTPGNVSSINAISYALEMQGMDMGINEAVFKKVDATNWQSSAIIPICTTGKRDWVLTIVIKSNKKISNYEINLKI